MDNDKKKKDEEEQVEGEEAEGEEEEKSEDLSQNDLEKSLSQLEAEVAGEDSTSRRDQLLEKAKSKDGLSKSEQDELFELLGGESREEEPALSEEITKGMEDNADLQKALDVSDFLREQHLELIKSLEIVADRVEQDGSRQHQFNLVLAKATAENGRATIECRDLIKSIAERIGVIERRPARAPKAKRSPAQPLEKGFAGEEPAGEDLSKAEILDTLEMMIEDSVKKGHAGNTEDGIDLGVAATKVESLGQIDPRLLARVKAFRARGGATVQ